MKQFLFFLLISTTIFAQDFSSIKTKTDAYSGLLTAEKLAENIKRDFSSNEDKVKAVFCWMTRNIRYDLVAFYNLKRNSRTRFSYQTIEERDKKLQEFKDKIVRTTLKTRKGICEGYAQTFAKVCTILNIENDLVEGYVRNSADKINNPILQSNHIWNAVKLNNKWVFIDVTWAAGYENTGKWYRKFNPYYYDIPTTKYFKTHYPEKSIWRLRIGRMEKETFYNQPIYSHDFLASDIELISPDSGILKRDRQGKVHIKLKKIHSTQQLHIGFLGSRFAQRPDVVKKDGLTIVSIIPPTRARQLSLLIDKQVALQFLIQ